MSTEIKAETKPAGKPAQPSPSATKMHAASASAIFSHAMPPAASSTALGQPAPEDGFQPKVYLPQDIACRHQNDDLTNCGAEQGEPCQWQQPGMEGAYHQERILDADSISQREGDAPTKEQFDQAVVDSGLF